MSIEKKMKQQYMKYGDIQSLMKYFTIDNLKQVHFSMNSKKAVGVDKVTKYEYNTNLDKKLQDLVERLRKGKYFPQPVRRVEIPKSNGKTRKLGIPAYEDKLVQAIFSEILNAIYEPLFLDCSNGYRENRNCHTALRQLNKAIHNGTKYIVECDIKGFFDNVNHQRLIELLELTIKDRHFIKYIYKFLTSGVMIDSNIEETETGTPQGGIISPILANVYLHYCLDVWFEDTIKAGNHSSSLIRYCDDFIACFTNMKEALMFITAVEDRLSEFGLNLQKEKTRIIKFDITDNTSDSFNFLGFNISVNDKQVLFRTSLAKTDSKYRKITDIVKTAIDDFYCQLVRELNQYLQGNYSYYGVTTNQDFIESIYSHTLSKFNSIPNIICNYPLPISDIAIPPSELLDL